MPRPVWSACGPIARLPILLGQVARAPAAGGGDGPPQDHRVLGGAARRARLADRASPGEGGVVMAVYVISLHGCDDVTVFRADLSAEQAALVRRLAALSLDASERDCQPTLHIDSFDFTDIDKVVS